MHIPDRERCNWLRARIETQEPPAYSVEKKLNILDRLTWCVCIGGGYGGGVRGVCVCVVVVVVCVLVGVVGWGGV